MAEELFERILVPLANPEDAVATASAPGHYPTAPVGSIVAVNVVEKAGGAPEKTSVEQREEYAEDVFRGFRAALGDASVDVETGDPLRDGRRGLDPEGRTRRGCERDRLHAPWREPVGEAPHRGHRDRARRGERPPRRGPS
jgi:hypothetical protein